MRAANSLGIGINGIAGADDYLNNASRYGESGLSKVVTVPAAVLITVPALMDRVPMYKPVQ